MNSELVVGICRDKRLVSSYLHRFEQQFLFLEVRRGKFVAS